MGLWMAYALLVGGMVSGAAAVAEWALRARGHAGRFAWMTAFGLSLALPVLALLRPASPTATSGVATGTASLPLELLAHGFQAIPRVPSLLERAEPWLLGLWLLATLLLGGALVGGLVRLSLKARRWPSARAGESDVLLSDGFGPALLGVGRLRVVVPRWALRLEPEQLRLVVLHEEEHRRAGDARVLLAAAVAVVAAPWNVTLWWQLRRLRAALELDCDARVLRRGASPTAYGALLLELGSHIPGLPLSVLPVAALSNPPSLLERRLKMIVRGVKRHGRAKALTAAAGAVLLVALACEAPSPTALRPTGGNDDAGQLDALKETVSIGSVVAGQVGEQPLVFVDGLLVPGKPSDIVGNLDQGTIQRIEVTKGEAARKMMGEAAAGGVIHITTTKGLDSLRAVKERALVGSARAAESARAHISEITVEGKVAPGDPSTMTRIRELTGSSDDGIRVDIDGVSFHGDLSSLDAGAIDHIDVVKGPGGRMIHITTKKAAGGGGKNF